jgi:hypothetical protein
MSNIEKNAAKNIPTVAKSSAFRKKLPIFDLNRHIHDLARKLININPVAKNKGEFLKNELFQKIMFMSGN